MAPLLPGRASPDERSDSDGGSSLAVGALGVVAGLVAAGVLALLYRTKHSPAGYATWTRREETVAPPGLVYIWRRADTDAISPPF